MEYHYNEIMRIYNEMTPVVTTPSGGMGRSTTLPPPLSEDEVSMEQGEVVVSIPILVQLAKERTPCGWEEVFQRCEGILSLISTNLAQYSKWYPEPENIFNAFHLTPLYKVKVVIVGQDPYPQGQAVGLSFSVRRGDSIPVSLANVFKEVKNNYPSILLNHGDLTSWALQGVLLLNRCLTVSPGSPGSHSGVGWMAFVNIIVKAIIEANPRVIFILWGNDAKQLCSLLPENVKRLTAAHPSGYSANRGFFGCGHFKEVNRILTEQHRSYLSRLLSYWTSLRPGLSYQAQKWTQQIESTLFSEVRNELSSLEKDETVPQDGDLRVSMETWLVAAEYEMINWSLT